MISTFPTTKKQASGHLSHDEFIHKILADYRICCLSREVSLLNRKEVLSGKAKFGISGEGKELAQVALAKYFKKGDFRSGYYRDQTLLFAIGALSIQDYFAQLYADIKHDSSSKGRQMVCHFASPFVDEQGEWLDLPNRYNISSDISCTAGQVARAMGLAMASQKFRDCPELSDHPLNDGGEGVVHFTIGDGSTSEGPFWEMMNAAAVTKIPLLVNVWDDGFAISVPKKYQTVKSSISKALEGFLVDEEGNGIHIFTVNGWDYAALCDVYAKANAIVREQHIPVLVHVKEMTQPQGHSTSGSHERYKSEERLAFEKDFDCNVKFREWILQHGFASVEQLDDINADAVKEARAAKKEAWKLYYDQVKELREDFLTMIRPIYKASNEKIIKEKFDALDSAQFIYPNEFLELARQLYVLLMDRHPSLVSPLKAWIGEKEALYTEQLSTHLYSETKYAALQCPVVVPTYDADAPEIPANEILSNFFKVAFEQYPELFAFGEDVGVLGDVNKGLAGMQDLYGKERVFDTGIREWTIVGQAMGMGMRGLRPIAEIQYIDYLLYGLAPLSDDLATLRYRTAGMQRSTCIIRTRGHRLEGIWHTGSPMGMMLSTLRGMYVCVPRNMVQAAGMYSTLLRSDDPAIVVEVLNAYRQREKMPNNLGEYTVPLGVPEVIKEGSDLTVVTYGACVAPCMKAALVLQELDVDVEVVDVQTLIPFDLEHVIAHRLKKTNKLLIVDEDVPGGASAYILDQLLSEQQIFNLLEISPRTITARAHRSPHGDLGNYMAKPNTEDIVEEVLDMMNEVSPQYYTSPKL